MKQVLHVASNGKEGNDVKSKGKSTNKGSQNRVFSFHSLNDNMDDKLKQKIIWLTQDLICFITFPTLDFFNRTTV